MMKNQRFSVPSWASAIPKLTVIGVGGAGGNAVNNMIQSNMHGVNFIAANTDAQALEASLAEVKLQLGPKAAYGLGAGAAPSVGKAAAEESSYEIIEYISGTDMLFIAAGMGGGTGTGASPVIAKIAREQGIITVAVLTKPFEFEGSYRSRMAEAGIEELKEHVDTYVVIHNQNLFRVISEATTFQEAFRMADNVLLMAIKSVTELITKPGLINLDFADIKSVVSNMGRAMIGCGEARGLDRAEIATNNAMHNPLLEENCLRQARAALINITGSMDVALMEIESITTKIKNELTDGANLILGTTIDESMGDALRVSILATSPEDVATPANPPTRHPVKNTTQRRPETNSRVNVAAAPPSYRNPPAPHQTRQNTAHDEFSQNNYERLNTPTFVRRKRALFTDYEKEFAVETEDDVI